MPWNSATPLAMKHIDAKQRAMDGFRYAFRYRALQEQGRLGFSNPPGPAGGSGGRGGFEPPINGLEVEPKPS